MRAFATAVHEKKQTGSNDLLREKGPRTLHHGF